MPAILLENLFLDSAMDTQYLKQSSFKEGLSLAIANGVLESLNKKF
ncbi:hypothetical protein ABRT01_17465 [Lentibacillus sp. L22]